jgi:HAD superfamily hydrolase (TIGR01484 family)
MRYRAIATDGDGTILVNGNIPQGTVAALERARCENLFLVLVTGQTRKELNEFPRIDLFHLVVAENGGVLFNPSNGLEIALGEAVPAELVRALRDAGLKHLRVGRCIISANVDDEQILRREVDRLKLNWHVIRNRHDAMVLPAGIDKATGVAAALNEINIRPAQVVAVGDAENDAAMLELCGLGIAVADGVHELKRRADAVTQKGAGQGIVQVINNILETKSQTFDASDVISH